MDHGEALVDDLTGLYGDLLAVLESALGAGHAALPRPMAVGVGIPGLVDRDGVLRFAPNLLGANGTHVRAELQARLGDQAHVYVDNDVACAAVGECTYGAGKGRTDALFVTIGTGIGGSIVSDGQALRGAANYSGEIGHVVVDPQGPPCGCGRRGCWERYASGSGLGRIARDAALAGQANRVRELAGGDPDEVRGEHVILAASEGDEEAEAIVGEFAWWLALGLANLANITDPEIVVIGGGLVRAGELLFGLVRREFALQLEAASLRPEIAILPAALGEHGGAIGAAVLGRRALSAAEP